jgi:uncharacterized lipoprotein YmbA
MRRWSPTALAIAGLVSALTAGCLGGSPPPRYYALAPTAARSAELPATSPDLGLAVGPIEFPRYLDRPEIVTRDGAHRLVLASTHRWGGSLRNDVLRVLADDLGRLLGTSRIAVYPTEPRFRVDYRVLLELLAFEGVPGEAVTLRARWVVASGADGRALAVEESHVVQPTASASWEDLVAAHSAALGTLSRQIAAKLADLSARPTRR